MSLETLSEAQQRLTNDGYVADLMVADGALRDPATGSSYPPTALRVSELVRFEGQSDPDDEAMLLAVETRGGEPVGTLAVPYGPAASAEQAEVVRHLHRVVVAVDDTGEHDAHDHIAAILPNRDAAEAAVGELREVGLGSDHLGVAVRQGEHVAFERDEEADFYHDVGQGIVAGASTGSLAGMLLFGLVVPVVGTIGVGGIAAIGVGSSLGGAMLGSYLGLAGSDEQFDSHQELRETRLSTDEVLVVACGHEHPKIVEAAMVRHGGRLVQPAA